MFRMKQVVALLLTASLSCGREEKPATPRADTSIPRSGIVKRTARPPVFHVTEAIDWNESGAVFIGIESFRSTVDVLPSVDFAADDATDMAYLFTHELKRNIPASRVSLLLAGTPAKSTSRAALAQLRAEAHVVIDSDETPLDAQAIYEQVRDTARQVGPHGVLVIFIATHGITVSDEHRLLTPDATYRAMHGITLATILQTMPAQSQTPVLLFVDACRTDVSDKLDPAVDARRFERLQFPAAYAIFAGATAGRESRSDPLLQNGYFTRAVLEGLRCHPRAPLITPVTLSTYVNDRVPALSGSRQRAEGRFSELDEEPLVVCTSIDVGEILYPSNGQSVEPNGTVMVRSFVPGLYATVVLCATPGVCSTANGGFTPMLLQQGSAQFINVQYGGIPPIRYQVYAALTADPQFLKSHTAMTFHGVPLDLRANRTVYWLGPINVNL